MTSSLPLAFDNTTLALFKACPRKYYLAHVEGWRPRTASAPLLFGADLHEALEVFDRERHQGVDHESALRAALRHALSAIAAWPADMATAPNRSPYHLLLTIVWYCDHYQDDAVETYVLPDGRPAIELSFRFELPISHQGQPFLYCGHIDKIGTFNGQVFALERKHTTYPLNSKYFERYNPNGQVSGYTYAAQLIFHAPAVGVIIDAVQVAATFSAPARGIATRTRGQLNEWLESTCHWIQQIEAAYSSGFWPMNEEACGNYGGCQFRGICSKTPEVRKNFLQTAFKIERWDPLKNRGGEA